VLLAAGAVLLDRRAVLHGFSGPYSTAISAVQLEGLFDREMRQFANHPDLRQASLRSLSLYGDAGGLCRTAGASGRVATLYDSGGDMPLAVAGAPWLDIGLWCVKSRAPGADRRGADHRAFFSQHCPQVAVRRALGQRHSQQTTSRSRRRRCRLGRSRCQTFLRIVVPLSWAAAERTWC